MRSRSACSASPMIAMAASQLRARCSSRWSPSILRQPFFRRKPPKTAGREEFGREFAQAIHQALRTRQQGRCGRHGHGVDGALDRRCHAPLRAAASQDVIARSSSPAAAPTIPRCSPCWPTNFGLCSLTIRALRRIRIALRSEGSRRLRAAGVRNLEPSAVQCSLGHGSEAARNPGKDFVCVRQPRNCHPERR